MKSPIRNMPICKETLNRVRVFGLLVAALAVSSNAYARTVCEGRGGTLHTTGDGSSCWYRCVGGKYDGQYFYDGRQGAPALPNLEATYPTCSARFTLKIQRGPDVCIGPGKKPTAPRATPTCARGKLMVDANDPSRDLCDLREQEPLDVPTSGSTL